MKTKLMWKQPVIYSTVLCCCYTILSCNYHPQENGSTATVVPESQPIPSLPKKRLINNQDGTITDTKTNLTWAAQTNNTDETTWGEANLYCNRYQGGGKPYWRLPTVAELQGLHSAANNCVSHEIVFSGGCGNAWSSQEGFVDGFGNMASVVTFCTQ